MTPVDAVVVVYRPWPTHDGPAIFVTTAAVVVTRAGWVTAAAVGMTVALGRTRSPSSSTPNTVRRVIIGRASDAVLVFVRGRPYTGRPKMRQGKNGASRREYFVP